MYLNNTHPFSITFQDYPEHHWAVSVFFQGCIRNCMGCQNSHLQEEMDCNFYSPSELHEILQEKTKKNRTNNIVLTGGDPLMSRQIVHIRQFLLKYGRYYNICIYTGASENEIKSKLKGINAVKYYKGGLFLESEKVKNPIGKSNSLFQLASKNQFFLNSKFEKISKEGVLYFE